MKRNKKMVLLKAQTAVFIALSFFLLYVACQPKDIVDPESEEWFDMLALEQLDKWRMKIRGYDLDQNPHETFILEEGLIGVNYENYDSFDQRFGHIFFDSSFASYLLDVDYRFIGEQCPGGPGWAFRNNGLMVHCQDPETMGLEQDFPISIEVQLLGGNGKDDRPTANLCTPGTHVIMQDSLFTPHCVNSNSQTYHGDQWVNTQVLVLNDSLISHIVEGDTVLQYSKPQIGGGVVSGYLPDQKIDGLPLHSGFIAVQSESHPTEFRKIRLLNLKGCMDPKAKNFKSYHQISDSNSCIY